MFAFLKEPYKINWNIILLTENNEDVFQSYLSSNKINVNNSVASLGFWLINWIISFPIVILSSTVISNTYIIHIFGISYLFYKFFIYQRFTHLIMIVISMISLSYEINSINKQIIPFHFHFFFIIYTLLPDLLSKYPFNFQYGIRCSRSRTYS